MITQRLNRSITYAAIEQLFDESLIEELEKEVFLTMTGVCRKGIVAGD